MENVSHSPCTLNACQQHKFVFYEIYNASPNKLRNKKFSYLIYVRVIASCLDLGM